MSNFFPRHLFRLKNMLILIFLMSQVFYSMYIIIISYSMILKTYLVGKNFQIEVVNVDIKKVDNDTVLFLTYNLCNPVNFKVRILSIQSIIYSNNEYIWTYTENFFASNFLIVAKSLLKSFVFSLPKTKINKITDEVSIKTYVLCEIIEPKPRRFILQFYFKDIKV